MAILKRATQLDVARRAGVSRATVSNVLTNRTGGKVPITAETQQRVLAAVEELGYQPHAAGRSLRSGRSGTVGVLIPDAANPLFWTIMRGAEAVTREHGYQLAITIADPEAEGERRSLRALAQQRLDGLLLFLTYPGRVASEIDTLRLQGAAIVTFGRVLPGKDALMMDYGPSATELTEYLLRLGHRRIGFIHGVARLALGSDRLFAYRHALRAAGIASERELIVHCGPGLDDGVQAAHRLLALSPRPTAIIGVNDLMAICAIQAASERGIAVSQELSVAGFDDIDLAAHVVPPLTSVRVRGEEIGRRAAELLLYRLGEPDAPAQQVAAQTQLIVRRSTGPVHLL
jgi:LacI family transcriptional regulator